MRFSRRVKKVYGMCDSSHSAIAVDIQDLTRTEEFQAEGRFPLPDPWWEITCTVIGRNKLKSNRSRNLNLDGGEGRVVTVCYKELQRECKLQHSWARTIHTFQVSTPGNALGFVLQRDSPLHPSLQGSEAETAVLVLGNGYQNRKHLCTAVTRGRKRVYQVRKTIRKQAVPRNTHLGRLVREPKWAKREPDGENATTKGAGDSCVAQCKAHAEPNGQPDGSCQVDGSEDLPSPSVRAKAATKEALCPNN